MRTRRNSSQIIGVALASGSVGCRPDRWDGAGRGCRTRQGKVDTATDALRNVSTGRSIIRVLGRARASRSRPVRHAGVRLPRHHTPDQGCRDVLPGRACDGFALADKAVSPISLPGLRDRRDGSTAYLSSTVLISFRVSIDGSPVSAELTFHGFGQCVVRRTRGTLRLASTPNRNGVQNISGR